MYTQKVIKKGDIYKVYCHKSEEFNLLSNCHDCELFKGYDPVTKTIQCEKPLGCGQCGAK